MDDIEVGGVPFLPPAYYGVGELTQEFFSIDRIDCEAMRKPLMGCCR